LFNKLSLFMTDPHHVLAVCCRTCAQLGDVLQQQQQLLQAAWMKLNAVQMGPSAHNMLYCSSVGSSACAVSAAAAAATAGAAATMPDSQLVQAVKLGSISYMMGPPESAALLPIGTAHVLLQSIHGSFSSTQVTKAGVVFL
jgi:hypothetical protein